VRQTNKKNQSLCRSFGMNYRNGMVRFKWSAGHQWLIPTISTTLGGWDWEDQGSRPDPISKITRAKWTGGIEVWLKQHSTYLSEFKLQCHRHTKKVISWTTVNVFLTGWQDKTGQEKKNFASKSSKSSSSNKNKILAIIHIDLQKLATQPLTIVVGWATGIFPNICLFPGSSSFKI
jgi:hypothetical protein